MPTTLATPAFGIALQMADSSGNNFATIAEMKDFNMTLSAQIEDSSAHNASAPARTKVPTLLNFGPIEFPVNWVPTAATHNPTTGILYVWKNRQERLFRVVFPNGGPTWSGYAVVENVKIGGPVAGLLAGSVTMQGSGDWTLA